MSVGGGPRLGPKWTRVLALGLVTLFLGLTLLHWQQRAATQPASWRSQRKPLHQPMRGPFAADDSNSILNCKSLDQVDETYSSLLAPMHGQSILIAAILHNAMHVLPAWTEAVLQSVALLAKGNISAHVSVYESGSSDETKPMLRELELWLKQHGIPCTIRMLPEKVAWAKVHRIEVLADFRNQALAPLWHGAEGKSGNSSSSSAPSFDHVLFLNDIVTCTEDVMELIVQHGVVQKADITCGMDWYDRNFYDTWVARNVDGGHMYTTISSDPTATDWNTVPAALHFPHKAREDLLLPFQVFSCWGGMAMFVAPPLLTQGVRFRAQNLTSTECGQSECFYLSKDFWRLGHRRIVTLPHVMTMYQVAGFSATKHLMRERIRFLGARRPTLGDPLSQAPGTNVTMVIQDWQTTSPSSLFCVHLEHQIGLHDADWNGAHLRPAAGEDLEG